MNGSRRAGWLVPFINRQTWTAVWAAALREPSVRAGGGGQEDGGNEVGGGGRGWAADRGPAGSEACRY